MCLKQLFFNSGHVELFKKFNAVLQLYLMRMSTIKHYFVVMFIFIV